MGTFFIISSLENSGPGLKEGRKRPNILVRNWTNAAHPIKFCRGNPRVNDTSDLPLSYWVWIYKKREVFSSLFFPIHFSKGLRDLEILY